MPFSRHVTLIIILAIVWCLLSGYYNLLLLSLGVASCLVSVWIYHRVVEGPQSLISQSWIKLTSPLAYAKYLAWLVIEIIKSSIDVIKVILNPSSVEQQFFEVDTGDLDQTSKVIYANSITLTPGTVTTRLDGDTIQVHGLTAASKAGLENNQMRDRVSQLKSFKDQEEIK